MGVSDSKLRAQFAAHPNLLFQWLDEYYRGGDLATALRLFRLEPQKCLSLRYTIAGEPDASVNKQRVEKLAKYPHHHAEQSSAMHWVCGGSFIGREVCRLALKLGLEMLAVDPTMHHTLDDEECTPFGLLMQRVATTHSDEYFDTQLQLMHKMLDLGLGAPDHAQIVTHLRRFGYYFSGPELSRLHHRVWALALEVAFPEDTHPQFRRALLLLATAGRSPYNVQGGSVDDGLDEALVVPDAVKPGLVWTHYYTKEFKQRPARALLKPNSLPVLMLYLKLDHVASVRAMLHQMPDACDVVIREHVAAAQASGQATTLFHLATGDGRTFKSVEVTTNKRDSQEKTTAILSDERDHYAKSVEPLCIELLAVTQRLFPETWREACWLAKDAKHRTALDNARELQMVIFLRQIGEQC